MTSNDLTARASTRKAVLAAMGAADSGTMFNWPTATAVIQLERGMVLIATDLEVAPDDMDAVVTLLELSGYHNGTDGPFTSDPGEPAEIMGTYTWSLSLGATLELS